MEYIVIFNHLAGISKVALLVRPIVHARVPPPYPLLQVLGHAASPEGMTFPQ